MIDAKRTPSSFFENNVHCQKLLDKYFRKYDSLKNKEYFAKILKKREMFKKVSRDFHMKLAKQEFSSLSKFDSDIKVLADPKQALATRIAMIRNAKQSIDLTTFIIGKDDVGYLILDELKQAIERGVSVRLVYDSFGTIFPGKHSMMNNSFKALQSVEPGYIRDEFGNLTNQKAKVEVVTFNAFSNMHLYVKKWYTQLTNLFRNVHSKKEVLQYKIGNRMHDKMMIVDVADSERSMAIMGGRNLADDYFDQAGFGEDFNDIEILLKLKDNSPDKRFSALLTEYVDRLYFHVGNKSLSNTFFGLAQKDEQFKRMSEAKANLNFDIDESIEELNKKKFFENGFHKSSVSLVHELNNLLGLSPRQKKFYKSSIIQNLHEDIRKAKRSITIVSPYVNLNSVDLAVLGNWLDADPDRVITIVTNSVVSNNHNIVQGLLDNIALPRIKEKLKSAYDNGQVKILNYKIDDIVYKSKKINRLRRIAVGKKRKYEILHPRLHTKMVTMDDNLAYVMSFNYNGRSRYLDTESGIKLFSSKEDEASLADVNEYVNSLKQDSIEFESADWHKMREDRKHRSVVRLQDFLAKVVKFFKLELFL